MTEVKDEELLPFGWAPGGYTINCSKCPGGKAPMDRWGAKRSWRCREHAVEDLLEIRRRVRAITTPRDMEPKLSSLEDFCREFIRDQKISCPETIGQCDRVIQNAYEFIEGICERVGYHKED